MKKTGYLHSIKEPHSVITAIESGLRFPDVLNVMLEKYEPEILRFAELVKNSSSSADLLARIRSKELDKTQRMAMLKMFRRCVSGVCDTEATKKISSVSTKSLVDAFGHTFTPIDKLKQNFLKMDRSEIAALAVLLGEYDNRGHQGYVLTGLFFDWFESQFASTLSIEGPRGAGPDVELSKLITTFTTLCPCDFAIRDVATREIKAVGFARYDSTRGGAQSDDRTGGNTSKVYAIRNHCNEFGNKLRIVFLADGPGLIHRDTWHEACTLDCSWDDNVRVTTLKTAAQRLTLDWILNG